MKAKLKSRRIRTLKELWAIEDEFPLALVPDPVHFSLKWGIPLSKSYLKYRHARDAKANGKTGLTPSRRVRRNRASHSRRRKTAAARSR